MNTDHPNQRPTFLRWSILPSVTLLLCVALAIPAAGASGPPAEAPVSSVPPALLNNFAIFRSPSEVVPPEIAEDVAKVNVGISPLAGHGYNAALGQEVVLPGNHAPLWVVPGRDQVMLYDQPKSRGFASTFATFPKALKYGLGLLGPVPKGKWRIKGIVPDGITGVRLSKTAVAPVVDNAFVRSVKKVNLWEDWIFIRAKQPIADQS